MEQQLTHYQKYHKNFSTMWMDRVTIDMAKTLAKAKETSVMNYLRTLINQEYQKLNKGE